MTRLFRPSRSWLLTTLFVASSAFAQQSPATPAAPALAPVVAPQAVAAAAPAAAPAPERALPAAVDIEIGNLSVQPGGLTAEQTQARALTVSASLGVKRAELDAANTKISETKIQFFPQLTLRGSYMRLSPVTAAFGSGALVGAQNAGPLSVGTRPGGTTQCVLDSKGSCVDAAAASFTFPQNNYSVGAGLAIPLSDYIFRVTDAAASASSSRDAARYAVLAEELKVRTDARVLYYNWLRTHGQVNIAGKAVERTQARLQDAHAAYDVGKLSQADLMRIEALVANAEAAQQQAESGRNMAGAQLAIIMQDLNGGEYTIGERVPELDAPDGDLVTSRKLMAEAWQKRLELKALDATENALDHGRSAVRVSQAPRVDAVADATYANPNSRYFPPSQTWHATWSAGVVASWNITDFFLNDARADELVASRAGVAAQRRGVQGAIAIEVSMAQLAVNNAHSALRAGATTLRAAEESYRVTTDLFRVGRATTSDLIDAESELLNARLSVFNARVDLTTAVIRLEHAVGRDAPST
ncbi:MAG TPA: TolC family protein [Polyangiales bacterium]